MAKVLWQINFKSLNGTSCRVDIYDPTVPEEAPISPMVYTGAEDPFYIEEDNSDDLLNGVLRYSTGYIRMIDNGSQYIQNIYPSEPFDRPVKAYYGTELIFSGYIQVQNFLDEVTPTPKVIEFPVVSTLGLMDQRKFGHQRFLPPTTKTLGQLLDVALNGFYDNVYLPWNYGYPSQVSFGMTVNTLVISPWNEDYCHAMNIGASYKMMKPKTCQYLIEIICKAFGWVCHDTPTALIFTAFDHIGNYVSYPVGHIGDNGYKTDVTIPSIASVLTDHFTYADNAANVKTIQPETGIEISYEGELGGDFTGFERTQFYDIATEPDTVLEEDERFSICNLTPVWAAQEIFGANLAATFENVHTPEDPSYLVTRGIYSVAWTDYQGVLISMMHSWTSGKELFRIRYYTKKITNVRYSVGYEALHNRNGFIAVLEDDTTSIMNNIRVTVNIYDDYVEAIFKLYITPTQSNPFNDYELVLIHNIKIGGVVEDEKPYAKYRIIPSNINDTIPVQNDSSNPVISSSITMPISLYRMDGNLIGNSVRSSKLTEYPYLFQKRQELVSKFKVVSAPTIPYARKFSYLNRNWRMIAQEFHPWNDEVTLTMQSSPILND